MKCLMPGARSNVKPLSAGESSVSSAADEVSQLEQHLQKQLEEDVARIFDESIYSDLEVVCGKLKILTHSCILKARTHKFYHKLEAILHVNIERDTFDEIYSFISDVYTECNIQKEEKEFISYLNEKLDLETSIKKKTQSRKPKEKDETEIYFTSHCVSPQEKTQQKSLSSSPSTELTKEYYAIVPIEGTVLDKELIEQDTLSCALRSINKSQYYDLYGKQNKQSIKPTSLSLNSSHELKIDKHSNDCDKTKLIGTSQTQKSIKQSDADKCVALCNKTSNSHEPILNKTLDPAYTPDSLYTDDRSSSSDYLSATYAVSPGTVFSCGFSQLNAEENPTKMDNIVTVSDSGLDTVGMLESLNSHKDVTLTDISFSESTIHDMSNDDNLCQESSSNNTDPIRAQIVNNRASLNASSSSTSMALNDRKSNKSTLTEMNTKEQKQRQNEEIVILESSSLSSETGSWESVFPPKLQEKDLCERFINSERQSALEVEKKTIPQNSSALPHESHDDLCPSLVQKSPFKSTHCFIDAASLADGDEVMTVNYEIEETAACLATRSDTLEPSQPVPCTLRRDLSPNDWSSSNDNEDSLEQAENKDTDSIQTDLSPVIFEMTPITEEPLCAKAFETCAQQRNHKAPLSSKVLSSNKSCTTPNNSITYVMSPPFYMNAAEENQRQGDCSQKNINHTNHQNNYGMSLNVTDTSIESVSNRHIYTDSDGRLDSYDGVQEILGENYAVMPSAIEIVSISDYFSGSQSNSSMVKIENIPTASADYECEPEQGDIEEKPRVPSNSSFWVVDLTENRLTDNCESTVEDNNKPVNKSVRGLRSASKSTTSIESYKSRSSVDSDSSEKSTHKFYIDLSTLPDALPPERKQNKDNRNEKNNMFSIYIDLDKDKPTKEMPARLSSSLNSKKSFRVENKNCSKTSRTPGACASTVNMPSDVYTESVLFEKMESLCEDPNISISEIINTNRHVQKSAKLINVEPKEHKFAKKDIRGQTACEESFCDDPAKNVVNTSHLHQNSCEFANTITKGNRLPKNYIREQSASGESFYENQTTTNVNTYRHFENFGESVNTRPRGNKMTTKVVEEQSASGELFCENQTTTNVNTYRHIENVDEFVNTRPRGNKMATKVVEEESASGESFCENQTTTNVNTYRHIENVDEFVNTRPRGNKMATKVVEEESASGESFGEYQTTANVNTCRHFENFGEFVYTRPRGNKMATQVIKEEPLLGESLVVNNRYLENSAELVEASASVETSDLFVKLSDLDKPAPKLDSLTVSSNIDSHERMTRSIPDNDWRESSHTINQRSNEIISSFHSENALSLNRLFPHLKKDFSRSMPGSLSTKRVRSPLRTLYASSSSKDIDERQTSDISEMSSVQSSYCRSVVDNSTTEETDTSRSLMTNCQSRLGQDLLHMFLEEIAPDVTVEVSGRRIKAHKCILSSRCQYFAGILSGGWVESAGDVISLPPFSYSAVHFALCHIYSGASVIPESVSIVELATLADMLSLEGLKEGIMYMLKSKYCHHFHKPCQVCTFGVLECFPLASVYGLDDLYRKCLRWITKYFYKVWPTKAFATMPQELIDKCCQEHIVNLTVDNVVDTVYGCGITVASLQNSRWASSVKRMCRKVENAAAHFAAARLSEVLHAMCTQPPDAPLDAKYALNECMSAAIKWAPLEESCRAYVLLCSVVKEMRTYSKPDLVTDSARTSDPVSLLKANAAAWRLQCETEIIRKAPQVCSTQAFMDMPQELRDRLRELGCIDVTQYRRPRPHFAPVRTSTPNAKSSSHRSNRNVDIDQVRAYFVPYVQRPPPQPFVDSQIRTSKHKKIPPKSKQDERAKPSKPMTSVRTTKAQEERAKFNSTKANQSQERLAVKPARVAHENTKTRYMEPRVAKENKLLKKPQPKMVSSSESSRNSSPVLARAARASRDTLAVRPRTADPSTDSLTETHKQDKYATYTKTKHNTEGSIESVTSQSVTKSQSSNSAKKTQKTTKIPVYLNKSSKTCNAVNLASRDPQKRQTQGDKSITSSLSPVIAPRNKIHDRKPSGSLMNATKSSQAKMVLKIVKDSKSIKYAGTQDRVKSSKQPTSRSPTSSDIPVMERSGTFLKEKPMFGDKTIDIDD